MENKTVELFIPGPAGRLEAKYYKNYKKSAPIALVLQPHPQYGGTMNNKVIFIKRIISFKNYSIVHCSSILRMRLQHKRYRSCLLFTFRIFRLNSSTWSWNKYFFIIIHNIFLVMITIVKKSRVYSMFNLRYFIFFNT